MKSFLELILMVGIIGGIGYIASLIIVLFALPFISIFALICHGPYGYRLYEIMQKFKFKKESTALIFNTIIISIVSMLWATGALMLYSHFQDTVILIAGIIQIIMAIIHPIIGAIYKNNLMEIDGSAVYSKMNIRKM